MSEDRTRIPPRDLAQLRQEAWIGDAVLSLFAREWILREHGKMSDALFRNMTSNAFLSTLGNPTRIEAEIGKIRKEEGLEAAFKHIEKKILPQFLSQEGNRKTKISQKKR